MEAIINFKRMYFCNPAYTFGDQRVNYFLQA